jgi:hypothetical protein
MKCNEKEEKKARECLKFLLLSMFCESRKVESLKSVFSSERE